MSIEADEDLFPKEYVDRLSDKLHNGWLSKHNRGKRKLYPIEDPALKDLDIKGFKGQRVLKSEVLPSGNFGNKGFVDQITEIETKDGKKLDVRGLSLFDCEFVSNDTSQKGTYLAQNINQPAELLNPELKHRLNGSLATQYLIELEPLCMNMAEGDFEEYKEDFAAIVHDVWVKNRQDTGSKELLVPYSQLSEEEKQRDRDVASMAVETFNEIKALARLKTVEMESIFEDLSVSDHKSVDKIGGWLKEIDLCDKILYGSPWGKESTNAYESVKKNVSQDLFALGYQRFEEMVAEEKLKSRDLAKMDNTGTGEKKKRKPSFGLDLESRVM